MGTKLFGRYKRRIANKVRRARMAPVVILGIIIIGLLIMDRGKQLGVVPSSYRPLLNLIASVESRGNYNAYFGNAHNSSVDFTKMSIAEVLEWQAQYVADGSPSSAVGRYQIIDTTLAGLIRDMNLDESQLFDESMQDRMAMTLLERRGSVSYVNNRLSRQDFAANIAKEWASLPSVTGANPDASYYAGDGLNQSLIGKEKVLSAIDEIEPESK